MLDWLADTWNAFVDFMWQIVLSFLGLLKDFFIWIMDSLMDLVIVALDGLAVTMDGLSVTQYFSAIPPETAYIINIVGLSEAMGMIIISLTVRMILQLIPFVRFGS